MALRAISLVLLCLLVSGCATNGTSLPSFGCTVFKPVRWSKKDTAETKRQNIANNAVGIKMCGWKP